MFRPTFVVLCTAFSLSSVVSAQAPSDGATPLRILVLGDSPTYCDLFAGGAGANWADHGHHVRFAYVSIGMAVRDPRGELRMRRALEAAEAGRALGVEYVVIGDPSGDALVDGALRSRLSQEIRDFLPDVIVAPDPGRALLGVAVHDAVREATPTHPPAIMYFQVSARAPASPDLVISIDSEITRKKQALETHRAVEYTFEPTVHSASPASIAVQRAVSSPPIPGAQREARTEAFVFAAGAAPDPTVLARLRLDSTAH